MRGILTLAASALGWLAVTGPRVIGLGIVIRQVCSVRPIPLPYSIRHRLGHVPDEELATDAKCAVHFIENERKRLGVAPHPVDAQLVEDPDTGNRSSRTLDSAGLALLGTMTDAELSRRTGVPATAIFKARTDRGISRHIKQHPGLNGEVLALLGTMSDAELSRQSGVPSGAIFRARTTQGILRYSKAVYTPVMQRGSLHKGSLPVLDDEVMRLLIWAPDIAVARRLDVSPHTVSKLRAEHGVPRLGLRQEPPEGLLDTLGTVEDTSLAERYGISVRSLRAIRKKLGIRSFREQNPAQIPQAAIEMLGKVSDRKLAIQFGRPAAIFRQARREMEIGPYQPKDRRNYTDLDGDLRELLSWASNSKVERETGMTVFKIKKFRETHDIPLVGLKTRPPIGLIQAVSSNTKSIAILAKEYQASRAMIKRIASKLAASAANSKGNSKLNSPTGGNQ